MPPRGIKIAAESCLDIEVTVQSPSGEVKKVWIPEGYYSGDDRERGLATRYCTGDEVHNGVAQGWTILSLEETCHCAACQGFY